MPAGGSQSYLDRRAAGRRRADADFRSEPGAADSPAAATAALMRLTLLAHDSFVRQLTVLDHHGALLFERLEHVIYILHEVFEEIVLAQLHEIDRLPRGDRLHRLAEPVNRADETMYVTNHVEGNDSQ